MLFGIRRGMPATLALATTLGLGLAMASSARADGMLFQHTIPREVDAYNFTTGGPFMAPPVPNGHYSKDYVAERISVSVALPATCTGSRAPDVAHCLFHKGDCGKHGGGTGCSLCGGKGCASCGGHAGKFGHGSDGVEYGPDAGVLASRRRLALWQLHQRNCGRHGRLRAT